MLRVSQHMPWTMVLAFAIEFKIGTQVDQPKPTQTAHWPVLVLQTGVGFGGKFACFRFQLGLSYSKSDSVPIPNLEQSNNFQNIYFILIFIEKKLINFILLLDPIPLKFYFTCLSFIYHNLIIYTLIITILFLSKSQRLIRY